MSQFIPNPAQTDVANEFTVEQLFDDGISFGSTATIQALTANLGGEGVTIYSEIYNFTSRTNEGRIHYGLLGTQTRFVNAVSNAAGRTAAYWFGLDSVQLGVGMVYEVDTGLLKVCNTTAAANSASYTANLILGETTSGGSIPTLGVLGHSPVARQTGGSATASGTYGATEQNMIQKAYDALRAFGFLT